jgi:hypothetical protein
VAIGDAAPASGRNDLGVGEVLVKSRTAVPSLRAARRSRREPSVPGRDRRASESGANSAYLPAAAASLAICWKIARAAEYLACAWASDVGKYQFHSPPRDVLAINWFIQST